MWMSLERARIPSEMIRSTSRTTGRWLASASEIAISSGAGWSASCTSSAEPSIPWSSLSTAFSGRYSSSSFSEIFEKLDELYRPEKAVDKLLQGDRKSTRLNSSHGYISYAVFCLKKKQ